MTRARSPHPRWATAEGNRRTCNIFCALPCWSCKHYITCSVCKSFYFTASSAPLANLKDIRLVVQFHAAIAVSGRACINKQGDRGRSLCCRVGVPASARLWSRAVWLGRRKLLQICKSWQIKELAIPGLWP